MIINPYELLAMDGLKNVSEREIRRKLKAIENMIRSYTHNNFQNREIRFACASLDGILHGINPYLRVKDTVQISDSINNGLYQIKEIKKSENVTVLDKNLYPTEYNLVTKVEYPQDIIEGVINLLLWDMENRKKVGIKSETLSRHSVTYYDQDANNQLLGYPISLMGFLKPYKKARF